MEHEPRCKVSGAYGVSEIHGGDPAREWPSMHPGRAREKGAPDFPKTMNP